MLLDYLYVKICNFVTFVHLRSILIGVRAVHLALNKINDINSHQFFGKYVLKAKYMLYGTVLTANQTIVGDFVQTILDSSHEPEILQENNK